MCNQDTPCTSLRLGNQGEMALPRARAKTGFLQEGETWGCHKSASTARCNSCLEPASPMPVEPVEEAPRRWHLLQPRTRRRIQLFPSDPRKITSPRCPAKRSPMKLRKGPTMPEHLLAARGGRIPSRWPLTSPLPNFSAPSHLGHAAGIPIATFMARLGTECDSTAFRSLCNHPRERERERDRDAEAGWESIA